MLLTNMTSTEDAKVSLIDLEDAGQATTSQTLSAGSPLYKSAAGNNPIQSNYTTTNYGSLDTTDDTRNPTSSPLGHRSGTNPDGAQADDINTTDSNAYQQKKTIAQGMMDLALLSANANQLRYVIELGHKHLFFWVNIALISISIFMQVAVGFGLVWKSVYDMRIPNEFNAAVRINNLVTIGILIITIDNVMISSFNIADTTNMTKITASEPLMN